MQETDTKRSVAAMIKRPLLAGAFAATAGVAPGVADAATDMFLRLDGIPGESTDAKHKDQIEILSFSLGFEQPPAGAAGQTRATCGEMVLTKSIDKSSPLLIREVMRGSKIKSGTLVFTTATGAATQDYYTLRLTTLQLIAIRQSDSVGGPRVTEQVTIKADAYVFEYRPQNADGSLGARQTFGWDCLKSAPIS